MSRALETLRLRSSDALFLDFDGTLAELGPDPDVIALPGGVAEALRRLAVRLDGAIALLSGRDIRDLAQRTPDFLWRAGGHGLEVLAPGAPVPPAPASLPDHVLAPLHAAAAVPGVRLELKGPVAALHYRAAPAAAAGCIAAAAAAAGLAAGLTHQAGKMVVEVKPAAAHKGTALRALLSQAPFVGRRPIMFGDDTTDEDAIAAAEALAGIGVKVGDGPSAASFRAPDPAAVRTWIANQVAPYL